MARLNTAGEASYTALADEFAVSEMTIRRDCELIEADGAARRIRGGICSTVSRAYEPPLAARLTVAAAAKRAIGLAAARLVSDGDTLILDVGTTTLELARALRGRQRLTVLTSSLPIAVKLGNEPGIRVLVTGGCVRPGELSLTGGTAEDVIRNVNCDLAILGVAGVSSLAGLSDYNPDDARVKRAAITSARRTVVLADATKLGRVTFATVAAINEVDTLVTDAWSTDPEVKRLSEAGLSILHADI